MLEVCFVLLLVVLGCILLAVQLRQSSNTRKSGSTIPGPPKTDPVKGNLPHVAAAGSLHEFVQKLHRTYGPITGFWLGPKYCVSIASPELFKEQAKAFDRPKELFELFEPLVSNHSIQYTNGDEGRRRHAAYKRCFSHEAMQQKYQMLQKCSAELCSHWATLPKKTHISLTEDFFLFAMKSTLAVTFGVSFEDNKKVASFKTAYEFVDYDGRITCRGHQCRVVGQEFYTVNYQPSVWSQMEKCLTGEIQSKQQKKMFGHYKSEMGKILQEALDATKDKDLDRDTFAKVVQEVNRLPDVIFADTLTMCVAGFHTNTYMLVWCMYFLAKHTQVQDKVYKEVSALVGNGEITFEAVGHMSYMRQVLNETLRCGSVVPFAARVQDTDTKLGGHKLTAGTPVMQALGVVLKDEKLWPDPERFYPERFSPEKRKTLPSFAFEPFGFAGKRRCPACRLTYTEACLLIGNLVRKFHIKLVDGQVVQPVYGLLTKPKEDIWVTLKLRK